MYYNKGEGEQKCWKRYDCRGIVNARISIYKVFHLTFSFITFLHYAHRGIDGQNPWGHHQTGE